MSMFSASKASNARLAYHKPGAVKQIGGILDSISPRYQLAKFTASGGVKVNATKGLADWEDYQPASDPINAEIAQREHEIAKTIGKLSKMRIVTLTSPRLVRPHGTVQIVNGKMIFKSLTGKVQATR